MIIGGFFMLGDRIRLIRESNKMSQVEFGKKLNVSKQAVSNWENNNIQPSVDIIKNIAIQFNVSTDFLLELDDRSCLFFDNQISIDIVTHLQQVVNDILVLHRKIGGIDKDDSDSSM